MKAIEQGIAKFTNITFEQEYEYAKKLIMRARGMVQDAMATGYIELPKGNQPPKPSKKIVAAVARATTAKPKKKTTKKVARRGKKKTR